MKEAVKNILRKWPTLDWALTGVYRSPIPFSIAIGRSLIATYRVTGRLLPVRVRIGCGQTLAVTRHKSASVELNGIFRVNAWAGSALPSSLSLGRCSRLVVEGDFEIGPNVHITLSQAASLVLGGTAHSTGSGITSDTRVLVEKSVTVGADSIIASGCVISDSNWHDIEGVDRAEAIKIDDNVWVSHGVSILKGTHIPSGCIIGARSVVNSKFQTNNSLIAGIPARIRRNCVKWTR
jgi:acetyltransferase-like isoleucine patch superfamily enzyme